MKLEEDCDEKIIDQCNSISFMMVILTAFCGGLFLFLPFDMWINMHTAVCPQELLFGSWILSGVGLTICILIFRWNDKRARKHGGVPMGESGSTMWLNT